MDAKQRKEIMSLCGAHSARTIAKLVSQKRSAQTVPDPLRARGYSVNFLGATLTRHLALRTGLLDGDMPAMWRGLRQSARLRWLELQLGGYQATSYMHMWDALDILATGEHEVFQRWVQAVPARIDSGHPYCVALSNGLTAWGRGGEALREQAFHGLLRARHSSRTNRFEKATVKVLLGGYLDDPAMVTAALDDGLRDWRPAAWQHKWFYIHHLMAVFNVARAMLSQVPPIPRHDRFIDPPAFGTPRGADLVDLSVHAPTLHRWVAQLPEQLDVDAWTTVPVSDEDETKLRTAIYAAPDDDGPRAVYADWLMSHGDPRGEFIALQLSAKLSKDDKTRVKQLGAAHGREWTAPLDRSQVVQPRYERGFVAECLIRSGPMQLDDNPAWATITALHGAVPGPDTQMPSLRTLGGLRSLAPLAGCARPLPIEALAFVGGRFDEPPELDASVCPQLAQLWILGRADWVAGIEGPQGRRFATPEALAWIVDAPFARGVQRLIVPLPCAKLASFVHAWLLDSPRLEQLVVSTQAGEAWDSGWQVQLTRLEDGVELHVASAPSKKAEHPGLFDALLTGLRSLSAGRIFEVHCDASIKKRPELEQLRAVLPKLRFSRLPRLAGFWATSR